jgi:hypothetical protein
MRHLPVYVGHDHRPRLTERYINLRGIHLKYLRLVLYTGTHSSQCRKPSKTFCICPMSLSSPFKFHCPSSIVRYGLALSCLALSNLPCLALPYAWPCLAVPCLTLCPALTYTCTCPSLPRLTHGLALQCLAVPCLTLGLTLPCPVFNVPVSSLAVTYTLPYPVLHIPVPCLAVTSTLPCRRPCPSYTSVLHMAFPCRALPCRALPGASYCSVSIGYGFVVCLRTTVK